MGCPRVEDAHRERPSVRPAEAHPHRAGVAHIWDPIRRQLKAAAKPKDLPADVRKAVKSALRAVDRFHPETKLPKKKAPVTLPDDLLVFLKRVLTAREGKLRK